MNFRTTIILFVLVIAGLIFFIVANRGGGTAEQARDSTGPGDVQQGRRLLDTKVEDVQRLVIKPAQGQPLELVKGEGAVEWKIVQPTAWAADNFDARNLVESVVNVRSRGRVEQGAGSRGDFGLEKPRYTIEITDKNNKTTTLLVGNQTALGNDLYVDASDGQGTSIVAGGELTGRLQKGTQKMFEALRDKRLVTAPATDVKQVEVTKKGSPKLVLRREGPDWKVVEPKQVNADSAEVSSLVSVVTGLRAEEFVPADSVEATGAMVDQPRVLVWFSSDAPSTQPATSPATGPATKPSGTTVAFGQYADVEREKVYVKVSPEPNVLAKVSVSEWQWDRLAQASPVTLRDRKVLDIDPERVEKVTLSIDRQAATQPTARPAEKREVALERRREPAATQKAADAGKNAEVQGDAVLAADITKAEAPKPADETTAKGEATAAPAAAKQTAPSTATAPTTTTGPTTTTVPSTAPAPPPTKWVLTSDPKGDDNDANVDSLLQALHPLRATKYLETAPTTPVTGTYTVKVYTNAYGEQPAQVYELKLIETGTGADAKVIGYHKDLIFEADRFFLDRLTADFKKSTETQPASPALPGIS
jgi:hypothetical protein